MLDALTGLPDRAAFIDRVGQALADSEQRPLAVVRLRPSDPHVFEDCGCYQADAVLTELASRISQCLRPGDVAARVGEAAFAVMTIADEEGAAELARTIMLAVDAPSRLRLPLGLVAGVTVTRAHLRPQERDRDRPPGESSQHGAGAPSAAVLCQQASIALSSVAAAPWSVGVFTPRMQRDHAAHRRLREAIARTPHMAAATDVEVLFEPVVELASGRLAGLAARAAWSEDDTAVPAGRLIAIARQAYLAGRLDEIVLRSAITRFAEWSVRWPGACDTLWVTLCAETLSDDGFPDRLRQLLAAASLPPNALVVDPLDDLYQGPHGDSARRTLRTLRAAGVRIAASNALALLDNPIDVMEPSRLLDHTTPGGDSDHTTPDGDSDHAGPGGGDGADFFGISPTAVERCVDDPRARRLVQATVEFASTRRAATTARQVTTLRQHEELRRLGCWVARGPLYGEPMLAASTNELVAAAATGAWRPPIAPQTEHHRASLAWQELRQVISSLPIAAFACDPDGILVLAEGGLLGKLGITAEATSQPLTTLIDDGHHEADPVNTERPDGGDPADDHPLTDAFRKTLCGSPTAVTLRSRGHWLQVHLCPRRAGTGGVTGVFGVAIDVTHRIQAEQALRESERRFRGIFTQAPVGMMIVSVDGTMVHTNPAMATMLGRAPEDLAGRRVFSLWHPESLEDVSSQFEGLCAGTIDEYRAEVRYRHSDGNQVWTRVTAARFSEPASEDAIIGIVEDLREVKRLEVKLRHAQKLEAVGMLASGIAHEINTPIQFVGDNINFLSEAFDQFSRLVTIALELGERSRSRPCPPASDGEPTDLAGREIARISAEADVPWLLEEVPSAARQSLEGVARIATIVRAMRSFGHPDQREPTPVDVNAAIRDTTTVARNEYKYIADLHLELGDVPPLLGYPSEFHQVVLNLIVNAAHAIDDAIRGTGRRGNITVRSWSDDASAHVSVSDDGCGMDAETRERIFEPFFTTKEVGRGTGQGLTIVYNVVVEKHNGTVEVASTPGRGSTFTVHLPRPAVLATPGRRASGGR